MGDSEGENYTELFAWPFITFLCRLLPFLSTIYDFYNFLFKELQDLAVKFLAINTANIVLQCYFYCGSVIIVYNPLLFIPFQTSTYICLAPSSLKF